MRRRPGSRMVPSPLTTMFGTQTRGAVSKLLDRAGIQVGGSRPWDLRVRDQRFYLRVLRHGSLGLGEAYMDGWWEAPEIDSFICRLMSVGLPRMTRRRWRVPLAALLGRLWNPQSRRRAARNARTHYEAGLDLFRAMLDSRLTYSSGYWRSATNLDEAQEAKLDLVCRKLELREGRTLLDIGCGWGSLARFAAERYGVRATGITVSPEQAKVARRACRGVPVEIRVEDYRSLRGRFDAVASVGMFEHVGPSNHRAYMETVARCLAPDGISLLHTILGNTETRTLDPWLERYIFPGAVLPTIGQITSASEGLFVVEDIHNFGPDYDRTLMAWYRRFEDAWASLRESYDDRFYRMWRYYLLACAGAFRARAIQVGQVLSTRPPRKRPAGADAR